MNIILLGGGDAGYYTIENGHLVHHGGWGVESLADVSRSLGILSEAARLKTPGLADKVGKGLTEMVQKELAAHLGAKFGNEGTVVVVNTTTH